MSGLIVREITDKDIERVSEIEEECFSMPWKPDDFRDMIARDNMIYVVAILDNEVIGGAGLIAMPLVGEADITNVAIAKQYRGYGYSKVMLKELLAIGEKKGCSDFTLEVRVSNKPAIGLYESLGFISEGIRPGFYDKPKEDALIMWKRNN